MGNKKKILLLLIFLIAGMTLWFSFRRASVKPSEEAAVRAAENYAEAIDYDYKSPERIYAFMTEDYQSVMSESEFVDAFNKERSYPYLTPLFINYDRVEMDADMMSGTAYYSQAARLPGMVYEVGLVYENGEYRIRDFEEFLDGSYLKKFDTVTYDLGSYFTMDPQEGEQE